MNRIVKSLVSPRVLTAVISAVSAVICAVFAGCKLYVGEMALKDVSSEIMSNYCAPTNTISK